MRLTEDQVRPALQHADRQVRTAALDYFAMSFSRNPAIMRDVIATIERFGTRETFPSWFPLANLAQTEETVAWAMKRLESPPSTDPDREFSRNLQPLLLEADWKAVEPHREAVLALPGLSRSSVARLRRRFELAKMTADQLWRRLEEIAAAGQGKQRRKDIESSEAKAIVAALGRDASNADRMSEWLRREFDRDAETPQAWLEIFAARMAGEMRYEPAVPLLVDKLDVGEKVLSEEANVALMKIGTDAVIRAVCNVYPNAEYHFRDYAVRLFGGIHTDLAVTAGLELLPLEEDDEARVWLATDLAHQFSTEAVEMGREVLREAPSYCRYELQSALVAACKLMGYEVSELKEWEEEIALSEQLFPEDDHFELSTRSPLFDNTASDALDDLPSVRLGDVDTVEEDKPLTRAAPVGRNDPCPCGSGKKFKKCCLRDQGPM
jgi:hypothetical protein